MSSDRSNLQTALYVGVPVLVGASAYYLYANSRNKKASSSTGGDSQKNAKKVELNPLEQLMELKKTGNQNFSRKNYDLAIEHYTKAIELSRTLPDTLVLSAEDLAIFYQNRAACNEALAKYEQVVEDCKHAIGLRKTYIKAYLRRAKAHDKLEKYESALIDAFTASTLEKYQNQATLTLIDTIVKTSSQAKAAEAMKTHKLDWPSNQTIKAYFSAFTLDPVKEHIADQNITSPEPLIPLLEEANKPENDSDPLSLLIRGSCLSLMGDMKNAQLAFDKVLSLDDTVCSPRFKANALIKKSALVISDSSSSASTMMSDIEKAYKLLDKAIELDPENPDIFLHKAQAFMLEEKIEDALATLEKAIKLKEDFHSAIAQKLYLEFKLATRDSLSNSKLQGLLDSFKDAIKASPEAEDLQQVYAQVLTEMSQFEEADKVLLKLSKLDPSDGSLNINRALLQFHLRNDPNEVIPFLQDALKLDPKIIFAYEILGSIETQGGRADKAIEIFETALKYAQSEAEYARCFSLLDTAKCQKAANEWLESSLTK